MLYADLALALPLAYLLGSISSAIVVCKLMGLPDPRTQGSNNPGATNVLRLGGKKAAVLTLAGDMLKGVIPVLVAKYFDFTDLELSLVALAAFIGHLFPIFFRFKGGKGVATLLGVSLALNFPMGLCLILTWLGVAFSFRYSSLAALVMTVCAPFYTWYFMDGASALVMGVMGILLIVRHWKNIQKLVGGMEAKIGKRS